ncbi:MAG: TetR/AcrR family transcriptional regulator [Verrucomicrobiota bacterium]
MKPGPEKQFDPEVALDAAIEVFRERGFEGASLSQLIAAMGIGKKSLYDTFGNKRSLFLRSIRHYGDGALQMMQEKLDSGKTPLDGFVRLFKAFENAAAETCSKGCMIASNLGDFDENDEDVAEILGTLLKQQERLFRNQLEKAAEHGELNSQVRPLAAARLLISLAQGTSIIGRVNAGPEPARSSYGEILRYLKAA